jgi:hypothetical protein
MLSSLIAICAHTAIAANVTDLPPQWRGDLGVHYSTTVIPDTLIEANQTVGQRRAVDHTITYAAQFGFTDYLSMALALPQQAASRVAFTEMNKMAYDPISQTGTMIGADKVAPSETGGSGAGGLWMRVKGTPLSESTFSDRGDQITWLLGLGYQFKDETSRWNSSSTDGAGPASPAFEFTSLWSTKNRAAEPYVGVVWTRRFSTPVDTGSGVVDVTDPSALDLLVGMEILLYQDDNWANKLGTEFALDLHATFGHATWGDGISGVEISNVLPMSDAKQVTTGETSSLWAGVDLRWRVVRYLDWTISSDFGGPLGRRLEHHYAISSESKMAWKVGTGLTFRMRDPIFDKR